jgi:hypothetical protein
MMWEHNDNGSLHRCLHYIGNSYKMQNRHLNVLHWLELIGKPHFRCLLYKTKGSPATPTSLRGGRSPATYIFTATRLVPDFYHALYKRKILVTPRSYIFTAAASSPSSTTPYTKDPLFSRLRLQRLHGRRIVASFHLGLKTKECVIKQF